MTDQLLLPPGEFIFAIALSIDDLGESVGHFAERIGAIFDAPLLAGTRQHRVKVSIGAAVFPGAGRTADELLSNSHLALSRAKATRRGGHLLFADSIRRELETRLTLEAELALAAERKAAGFVLGLPINMDGSEGPRAQATRAFARNMAKLTDLPIALWDERLSTAAVERELIAADASRAKRKAVIDQHAAIFILQGALDRLQRGTV